MLAVMPFHREKMPLCLTICMKQSVIPLKWTSTPPRCGRCALWAWNKARGEQKEKSQTQHEAVEESWAVGTWFTTLTWGIAKVLFSFCCSFWGNDWRFFLYLFVFFRFNAFITSYSKDDMSNNSQHIRLPTISCFICKPGFFPFRNAPSSFSQNIPVC